MHDFAAYVRDRDARRHEGSLTGGSDWVPFGVERPSGKIPTCKERYRRLVSRFQPKMIKQVATVAAVPRPRHSPMRWGPVR